MNDAEHAIHHETVCERYAKMLDPNTRRKDLERINSQREAARIEAYESLSLMSAGIPEINTPEEVG